jgi:precorrin-3B methylase
MNVEPMVISSMEEEVVAMVAKGDDGVYTFMVVFLLLQQAEKWGWPVQVCSYGT